MKVFVFFPKKNLPSVTFLTWFPRWVPPVRLRPTDLGLPLRLASRLNPLAHVKATVILNGH